MGGCGFGRHKRIAAAPRNERVDDANGRRAEWIAAQSAPTGRERTSPRGAGIDQAFLAKGRSRSVNALLSPFSRLAFIQFLTVSV